MSYKRRRAKWSIALIILLFSVFCTTIPAFAEQEQEASYSIKDYISSITLNSDGSVYFDETVTYQLLNDKVEITKTLPMANSSKVEDMEVFRLNNTNHEASEADLDLIPVEQVEQSASSNGETYTYQLADADSDLYHIIIPIEGKKQDKVTFVYRYKMLDTVFLYNDVAVFYWQYLMPKEISEVKNIDIQISLPEAIPVDQWNGYARGAAYAQKELLEDGLFHLTLDSFREGEYLESILLLPKTLFPDGRKIIDNYAEQEIASDMAAWEDEASRTRKEEELRYYSGWSLGLMAILLCIGTGLLIYLKTRRKTDSEKSDNIKNMIDTSISPAELGVLLKGKKAGVEEFVATLLSLIQCGYLELQQREGGEGFLILREEINKSMLKPHEEYVLNWLIADQGSGRELSLNSLDQVLADFGREHRHKVSTWQSLITQRVTKHFSEKISKMKKWAIGAVLISLIAGALAWFALYNLLAGLLAGICSLALAAYIIMLKNINEVGEAVKTEWLSHKDELLAKLNDEKNLLPLNKWEKELIYALPLGITGKVYDRLLQLYDDKAFEDGNLTILYKNNLPWISKMLNNLKQYGSSKIVNTIFLHR